MEVTLRDATLADAQFLFDLRTDPTVISASNRPAPPTETDHAVWLTISLMDLDHIRLFIIDVDGVIAGQCRLDRDAKHTAEVSIALVRAARGQGVGTVALRELARRANDLGVRWLEAVIKETNMPSRKAFLNAGFSVEEIGDGLVHMSLKC